VNMVTKSGTNTFHGGASVFYEPESLQEQEENTPYAWNEQEETSTRGQRLDRRPDRQGQAVLLRLRAVRDTDYLVTSAATATHEQGGEPTTAASSTGTSPQPRLEGTYLTDETTIEQDLYGISDGVVDFSDYRSSGERSRGGENYIGKYTGILSSNFLLSAQYGFNAFDRTTARPATSSPTPSTPLRDRHPDGQLDNYQRGHAEDEREASRIDATLPRNTACAAASTTRATGRQLGRLLGRLPDHLLLQQRPLRRSA